MRYDVIIVVQVRVVQQGRGDGSGGSASAVSSGGGRRRNGDFAGGVRRARDSGGCCDPDPEVRTAATAAAAEANPTAAAATAASSAAAAAAAAGAAIAACPGSVALLLPAAGWRGRLFGPTCQTRAPLQQGAEQAQQEGVQLGKYGYGYGYGYGTEHGDPSDGGGSVAAGWGGAAGATVTPGSQAAGSEQDVLLLHPRWSLCGQLNGWNYGYDLDELEEELCWQLDAVPLDQPPPPPPPLSRPPGGAMSLSPVEGRPVRDAGVRVEALQPSLLPPGSLSSDPAAELPPAAAPAVPVPPRPGSAGEAERRGRVDPLAGPTQLDPVAMMEQQQQQQGQGQGQGVEEEQHRRQGQHHEQLQQRLRRLHQIVAAGALGRGALRLPSSIIVPITDFGALTNTIFKTQVNQFPSLTADDTQTLRVATAVGGLAGFEQVLQRQGTTGTLGGFDRTEPLTFTFGFNARSVTGTLISRLPLPGFSARERPTPEDPRVSVALGLSSIILGG
ncbi:hypothetical protein TSOC_012919 [Tetrabaena socialis]|uniref:Uncharacterized protein n=1 Tax=Tetrabaena socialis TaxID=47790 RepID=A0A2J7ZLR1_9CHLO|nr:hypothetical protein TSOC_012919 [Tetrabaena socialis]|eukprot:PNH01208.1 hypothetical protein TSOC_012919 [Tetrabaena socialis]